MTNVVCNKCGQTGMLIVPGSPCLRKYADNTQVCNGTMEEDLNEVGELSEKLTPAYRQAQNRKRRKALGICRQCADSLAPNSIAFCQKHLDEHRQKAKQTYVSKARH